MNHLAIAREKGMKAGFNAYVATLERSGLQTAQAKLAEIRSMGKRKAFAAYCASKGPDVLARPVTRKRTSRPAVVESVPAGLAEEVLAARKRLAELEAELNAQPKSQPEQGKENLWRPWAIRKYDIPTAVGATFVYKGKRRTTTFKVVRVTAEGVFTVKA
jgi:hypothetical protein